MSRAFSETFHARLPPKADRRASRMPMHLSWDAPKLTIRYMLCTPPLYLLGTSRGGEGLTKKPLKSLEIKGLFYLAVKVGFEPTIRFLVYTLSRRAPSTARTLHRVSPDIAACRGSANVAEEHAKGKIFFQKIHVVMPNAGLRTWLHRGWPQIVVGQTR